jgi:hypothetical protein
MAQLITLGGQTIKAMDPGNFGIERYKLTKSGRVASGDMVMDLVAKKVKLTLKWEVLSGADLKTIADIVDSDTMFFETTYMDDNGEIKTITVYSGALKYVAFRSDQGIYWRDVAVDLIQQ